MMATFKARGERGRRGDRYIHHVAIEDLGALEPKLVAYCMTCNHMQLRGDVRTPQQRFQARGDSGF